MGAGPLRFGSSSSLGSRFRLVEELIEAGESGRDNAATPLAWGATTAGEAMFGGGGGCKKAVVVVEVVKKEDPETGWG